MISRHAVTGQFEKRTKSWMNGRSHITAFVSRDQELEGIWLGAIRMKIRTNTALPLVCVLFGLLTSSCDKKPAQSTNETPNQPTVQIPPPVTPIKHYHLKGKVVSIDKQGKMLNVDSEAIPGFMDAMTMPYKVKPEGELDKLHPGDVITADLLVQDEGAWLENIAVTGHSSAAATK